MSLSPEEETRRVAIQKTRNRMERISQYAGAALPAFLNNPPFWLEASKSLAGSHALFADLAWAQGLAMEERGQAMFQELLNAELNPRKKEADNEQMVEKTKSSIIVP